MIKVTRELSKVLRGGAEQVVVQLGNARPAELAAGAMQAASNAVMSADRGSEQPDTPSFSSGVAEHRGGPTLLFDTSSMSDEGIASLGDRMIVALEAAGIESGTLRIPKATGQWLRLRGPSMALMVFGEPRPPRKQSRPPEEWSAEGAEWLRGLDDVQEYFGMMFGVQIETPLTPDALESFARHRRTQWGWEGADVYGVGSAGDRGMLCGLPGLPSVTYAATITGDEGAARADLEALARRLDPPFQYACITTFDHPRFPWGAQLPCALGGDLGHYGGITHLRVPGIYEWQVVSATHLEQLDDPPAGVMWPDGRLEISSRRGEPTGLEPLVIQSVRDAYEVTMRAAGLEPLPPDRFTTTVDPPRT